MSYYLYLVVNLLNEKKYFGYSKDPLLRWHTHHGRSNNYPLSKITEIALLKHCILHYSKNKDLIYLLETSYIYYFENIQPNGYNLSSNYPLSNIETYLKRKANDLFDEFELKVYNIIEGELSFVIKDSSMFIYIIREVIGIDTDNVYFWVVNYKN